ncbi:hypothetical protein KBD09_02190 [Candidatus Woesebacteria bacterium]|nr:hypothetical protein [Candidatus Woesebacteria bacterium]
MISLNREPLDIISLEFPILINGADKTGASHYSIELLAELYKANNKILFFSGYEMAKSAIKERLGDIFDEQKIRILDDANEEQLMEALKTTPDIESHVLYIKNFDLYAPETIKEVLKFSRVLFMGDVEKAKAKEDIVAFDWKTKVSFGRPEVEKYYGVMESSMLSGITHIEQ